MSNDLKTKGEIWRARMFKMIVLFSVLGAIMLIVAVSMVGKMFNEILAPASPSMITPIFTQSDGVR